MRVMVLGKASRETEAGGMPTAQAWEDMEKFNEELARAGIVLAGEGLKPSSEGVRIRFSGKERIVTNGPFAETRELVAGYSIWQVNSMDEAIAWAKRCPLTDSDLEIRPIFSYSPEDVSQIQGEHTMAQPARNTICLWYDREAEQAAQFYARTFPDSSVGAVHRAPADYPSGQQGDVLTVEFVVLGIPCLGLNGGPQFKHSEAFSFQVTTGDQAETDRYWNAIVGNGGEESMCGWCRDKWGISWQITPLALTKAFTDPDRAAAKRAFEAMMQMKKIDIAAIEAAHRG